MVRVKREKLGSRAELANQPRNIIQSADVVYVMEGYMHTDVMVRLYVALRGLRVSHATQAHRANLGDPPHSSNRRIAR